LYIFSFGFVHHIQTAKYNIFGHGKGISQQLRWYNDSPQYICLFCYKLKLGKLLDFGGAISA
jgi:hypothetical protein